MSATLRRRRTGAGLPKIHSERTIGEYEVRRVSISSPGGDRKGRNSQTEQKVSFQCRI
jgi:hypothetical protein